MSNIIVPEYWTKDQNGADRTSPLFQQFTIATQSHAIHKLILEHKQQLSSLTDGDLVHYCQNSLIDKLPEGVVAILNGIAKGHSQAGLLKGFYFGDESMSKDDKAEIAALTMAALHSIMGVEPSRNADNGIRVDTIFPENLGGAKQIRSAQRLDYSNDAMAAEIVPQFGSVACIQGDPSAAIEIHAVDMLKAHLFRATLNELKKPNFWFAEDSFMKKSVEAAGAKPMHEQPDHPSLKLIKKEDGYAILSPSGIRYSQDSAGITQLSQNALDELIEVITNLQPLSLNVEAGDIVVRNNQTTIYGRSECQKWGTGEDVSFLVRQRAFEPKAA